MAAKPKRFKPKSDPKNIYSDTKRSDVPGETKQISRTRTAPKSAYGPYEVSKPYNNFVLRKSGDRAVAKAKKFNTTKAAERLASPPTKPLNINMGKAPAMKFAEDVGLRGATKLASRAIPVVAAAQTGYEIGDALKDTGPALKARRALSDAAAEFTGLAKKEREALSPVIKARSLNPKAGIDGIARKGGTKGTVR